MFRTVGLYPVFVLQCLDSVSFREFDEIQKGVKKMRWEMEGHSDRQKTESDGSNG